MSAPLYGLILAGGRSSRMGRDKSALAFHGKDQVHHLAERLAPYMERLFVSLRTEQSGAPQFEGMHTIHDRYASPSPLNGIVSAMDQYPGVAWLVLAVDMPNVTPQAIQALVTARDTDYLATSFESPVKGGADPLFAIWEPSSAAELRLRLLAAKETHVCPRQVLASLRALLLKAPSDDVLANINTSQELEAWRKHYA